MSEPKGETDVKVPPQISVLSPAHWNEQFVSGSFVDRLLRYGEHQHSRPYSRPAKVLLPQAAVHTSTVMVLEESYFGNLI